MSNEFIDDLRKIVKEQDEEEKKERAKEKVKEKISLPEVAYNYKHKLEELEKIRIQFEELEKQQEKLIKEKEELERILKNEASADVITIFSLNMNNVIVVTNPSGEFQHRKVSLQQIKFNFPKD